MRTFTEKVMTTQQTTLAKSTTPGRGHFGHGHEANSIPYFQRTIGNQAVLRMLNGNTENRKRDFTTTGIPHVGNDFSRIPVYRRAPASEGTNSPALTFLPAAPQPPARVGPVPPSPLSRAGVADLYITVRAPSQIKAESIFTSDPFLAPSSGVSFQLARHGKLRQDEYVTGNLRWKPAGSRLPEAGQPEAYATFTHNWTSETEDRTDLPGSPIMLKDFDQHTYGLAIVPGSTCEEAAKKHRPPFDRKRDDWAFTELGKFVDTVTFPDKEMRRVYYFDYRCVKIGSTVKANVEYTNVDKLERFSY